MTPKMTKKQDRDRDEEGRGARQARPRDELGRPLPYDAVGVEPVSEDPLPPLETVEKALALVREGRPFSAHEVLEARWKAGPDEERDLWQGLAQICVGSPTPSGATPSARAGWSSAGSIGIEQYAGTGGPTYGLDLDEVARKAGRVFAG